MHRRSDIEALRVLSAFSIVWYHCGAPGHNVAYAGLIVFIVLSVYLASGRVNRPAAAKYRAVRLLMPWSLWFVIYMGVNWFMDERPLPTDNGIVAGVLAGPSIHLWYLPFIFIVLTAFDAIINRLRPVTIATAAAALTIAVMLTSGVWREPSLRLGAPLAQYAHAVTAVFAGAFLGFQHALDRRLAIAWLGGILFACLLNLPVDGMGLPYLIGLAITSLVVMLGEFELARPALIVTIADLTLGIYLAHAAVSLLVRKFVPALPSVALSFAVFAASAVLVYAARRIAPSLSRYAA